MKYLVTLIFIISILTIKAQESYHFNQLDSLQSIKRKKKLIIVGTNWCNYCKALETIIAKDTKLKQLINDQYYLIKLDAEEKKEITYQDFKFQFNSKLGYHQKLSFPSIYLINNKEEIYFSSKGLMSAKNLLRVLSHN